MKFTDFNTTKNSDGMIPAVIQDADTLKELISESGEVCYIVVNYTVHFETQSILKALEDK